MCAAADSVLCEQVLHAPQVADAFFAVVDIRPSAASTTVFAAALGGIDTDSAAHFVLGDSGRLYVTGLASAGFIATPGTFGPEYNHGFYDSFVACFDLAAYRAEIRSTE